MTPAALDFQLRAKFFTALLHQAKMELLPNGTFSVENDERLAALLIQDAKHRPDLAKRILDDVVNTILYRTLIERKALEYRLQELKALTNPAEPDAPLPPPPPSTPAQKRHSPTQGHTTPPLPSSPCVRFLEPVDTPTFAL